MGDFIGYQSIGGDAAYVNNLSENADQIVKEDGWAAGIRLHPDYSQYSDEQAGWNVAGKGWKNNANNPTTSANTLRSIYPYNNGLRYANWQGNERYHALFSNRSIKFMQEMIMKGLKGVHPEGKNIVVKEDIIKSVADSIFNSSFSNAQQMQMMTINFIINHIKNEYQTIEQNNKLSIWVTKYGIESGMKQFNDVKLNDKSRSNYFYVRY